MEADALHPATNRLDVPPAPSGAPVEDDESGTHGGIVAVDRPPPEPIIPGTMEQGTAYHLESMSGRELRGRRVRLSDDREGEVVHVEYESPERVALVKTCEETPCPLTRVGVDRLSPPHLPYITELLES